MITLAIVSLASLGQLKTNTSELFVKNSFQLSLNKVNAISKDTSDANKRDNYLITEKAAKDYADKDRFVFGSGFTYSGDTVNAAGGGSTPTLQQVLDNNHDLIDGNNFQGTGAGSSNTGALVNAFGISTSISNSGSNINSFGTLSAGYNTGSSVNAIGHYSATINIGSYVNAIGYLSAYNNKTSFVNAIGPSSCYANEGVNVNAMGNGSGASNIYGNVNLFGQNSEADGAGQTALSQGTYNARLDYNHITDHRKYRLPDSSGTIALLSNITGGSNEIIGEEATGSTTATITTAFTPITGKYAIYKNGVRLPASEYSVSGTTVTLTSARVSTDLFIQDYKY